jgi:hypothetical protein
MIVIKFGITVYESGTLWFETVTTYQPLETFSMPTVLQYLSHKQHLRFETFSMPMVLQYLSHKQHLRLLNIEKYDSIFYKRILIY